MVLKVLVVEEMACVVVQVLRCLLVLSTSL